MKSGSGSRPLALATVALSISMFAMFAALPLLVKLAVAALAAGGWCFLLEHRGT